MNKQAPFFYRNVIKAIMVLLIGLMVSSCGGGGGKSDDEGSRKPITTFNVNTTAITVDDKSNTEVITITTTESWTISNTADWLTLSATSGSGTQTLTLTIVMNELSTSRNAELSIHAGSLTKTIAIQQSAASVSDYDIPADSTGMRDIDSAAFTDLMGLGFNIGNSLDAVGGETAWGNPLITKALVDAIKGCGF